MKTILSFHYTPVVISIGKDNLSLSDGVDIFFSHEGGDVELCLTREQACALHTRLKYFVEKNYYASSIKKKEGEGICITMKNSQANLSETDVKTIRKFLHSLTETDVGFFKNTSTAKDCLSQECGDTLTQDTIFPKRNG